MNAPTAPVRLLVLGAGNRGVNAYGSWCLEHPDQARVVAVADPDPARRNALADSHHVDHAHRYATWREALREPGDWDAVVVATPDRAHVEPALRALKLGYEVLLEKPIAPTPADVARLARAAAERPDAITVGHVLRYTPFFSTIKRLLDEGHLGDLQAIQYTENIGFWHFAHSYVRGNWHRSEDASPMLLAKACHDLDILRWLVGVPCRRVSSFGHLSHFRFEHAPEGSTERCMDGCAVADTCPYNAVRFYAEDLADLHGPPVTAVTRDTSLQGRMRALAETDYGRCVYRMDNDVVDHQSVNLEFENGATAALVVSAFTSENTRTLQLMGSHGELHGHLERGEITLTRFSEFSPRVGRRKTPLSGAADPEVITLRPAKRDQSPAIEAYTGHAGGDAGLMAAFTARIRERRQTGHAPSALTSLQESLESHVMAFAAEESRRRGETVDCRAGLPELDGSVAR